MPQKSRYSALKDRIVFIRKLSWLVSYLFHPVLITTYLFLLIQGFAPSVLSPIPDEGRDDFILIIVISTFLLPTLALVSTLLITKRSFRMKDLLMEKKSDRVVPFIFTGAFYLALAATLFYQVHRIVYILVFTIGLLILITGIISRFWKMSAHATALSGAAGYLLALAYFFPGTELFYAVLLVILAAGFTLSARLYLNAHTPLQVMAGSLTGFFWAILSTYLMLRFSIAISF